MRKSALVILSGGQDSTTCLYWALNRFEEVHAITFDYGQRHRAEIDAASAVAANVGVATHIIQQAPGLAGTSPLVSKDFELEQYEHHSVLPGGLEKTFVPMRNQLFITLAANRAYVLGCRDLVTGVCQEDYGGYPDCRQHFITVLEHAINAGTFTGVDGALGRLTIHTPLMHISKAVSVYLAVAEGAYSALALTHTSYDGKFPPTGKDHATLLRQKGFEEAGIPDPLVLRAVDEGLMDLPDTPNYRGAALALGRNLLAEGGARGYRSHSPR